MQKIDPKDKRFGKDAGKYRVEAQFFIIDNDTNLPVEVDGLEQIPLDAVEANSGNVGWDGGTIINTPAGLLWLTAHATVKGSKKIQ